MSFKFTIQSKPFADKLSALLRVLNAKNTLQILDNFKIVQNEQGIRLTASNIDNTAIVSVMPDKAEGEGSVLVNAKRLTDTVRRLEGDITITVTDTNDINIKTSTGNYDLQGIAANEYPMIEQVATDAQLTFGTEDLLNALGTVAFAVADDDYRPAMMGVYVDFLDDQVNFVATDTRVLAKYALLTGTAGAADAQGVIISAKTVGLVQALFGKEASVTMAYNDKKVVFKNNEVELIATLILGEYPDYNRVIPNNSTLHVKIDRTTLMKAIGRVSAYADNTNLLRMVFSGDKVTLDCRDINTLNFAEETIPCDCATDLVIGFSHTYLMQALANMPNDEVDLAMNDASRPVIITCGGNEMVLLMPMSTLSYE